MARTALIFGISGQDGAYLAHLLLAKGYDVHGVSRDAELNGFARLVRLGIRGRVTVHSASITDFRSVLGVIRAVEPDEIYNLAGQTSVALSFTLPIDTFESITVGSVNLLECVRMFRPSARLFNAASSECFGTRTEPADERTPFRPLSVYATAKAASFWSTANYRDAFGLYACSGILSNHESPFRASRFVTAKIVASAADIAAGRADRLTLGNLDVMRDWGWAPEYVWAAWRMLQQPTPRDYVIATGETRPLSAFVAAVFDAFGLDWTRHVARDPALLRAFELGESRLDPARAAHDLGWVASSRMAEVARHLVAAVQTGGIGPVPWSDEPLAPPAA